MPSGRTAGLALALALLLGAGSFAVWRHSKPPALPCAAGAVRVDGQGVAQCGGAGVPLTAAQRLALGGKLDLNRATAQELELIPGVGPSFARALVEQRARLGPFHSWDELDRVPGVGPARLEVLQRHGELGIAPMGR
jgi:competence protein ComEA